jgi:hypothetical protein
MPDEALTLANLKTAVETEIARYVYSCPPDAIGLPWSSEKISSKLAEMRNALVDPYWLNVELRDSFEQIALPEPVVQRCVVVADDRRGFLLLWDPVKCDFFLAQRSDGLPTSIGVRGDAVGCFLSR